ncbi:MAG: PH domain-containing protein [Patescibacteria group bacterium]
MVTEESVHAQLKSLGFKTFGWGKAEVGELHNILLPDEEIFECVNGFYEGGFALLLATDIRVLLVDKKPLNYLTVEDLRFDMINEIDYNHRLLGAYITIATGSKLLKFTSYNQARLRKLIGHVQHAMAEIKKTVVGHQEGQNQHLEQINQQLQTYLIAQYQQQQKLHEQLQTFQASQGDGALPVVPSAIAQPIKPSPELADYLYAQGLLAEAKLQNTPASASVAQTPVQEAIRPAEFAEYAPVPKRDELAELYSEGMQEIFGKNDQPVAVTEQRSFSSRTTPKSLEINPLKVAYSKLPMVLRNRKFGKFGMARR